MFSGGQTGSMVGGWVVLVSVRRGMWGYFVCSREGRGTKIWSPNTSRVSYTIAAAFNHMIIFICQAFSYSTTRTVTDI